MSVKITTLMENRPGEHHGLKTEHGLSFFIEKDSHTILFDTGQSGAFIENGVQLKVDLTTVDHVVLSHGHYDHSGGLRSLVEINTDFNLILGEDFFEEKYGYSDSDCEYLGNNFNRKFLEEHRISYQFTKSPFTEIISDVYAVSNFSRIHADEKINPRFKIIKDGAFVPDLFNDEVLLAIDTTEGLVVLLGCSHPGMKNMLDHTANILNRPLHAILGGTHLVEASEQSLELSMTYLQNSSLSVIGSSHCTGQQIIDRLAISSNRFFNNCTGSSLIVD